MGVGLTDAPAWQTAETPVFKYITAQLEMCQQNGLSAMLCDLTDIGKTYTARQYVKTHRNAVYVDCSQVKTRQKLLRGIAREFGVGSTGRLADVYNDLVFYLKTLDRPLVILDEAGNLKASRVLQLQKMAEETGDERFIEGVRIIQESYQPTPSKDYIRAAVRDESGAWVPIPLSMTDV